MRVGTKLAALSCAVLAAVVFAPSGARAVDKPDAGVKVATSTVAVALSAEELELARWLDVLRELEVLEDLECLELMSVLEDDHEP
jgi:hypothetical protein